jgi:hypothetical protein
MRGPAGALKPKPVARLDAIELGAILAALAAGGVRVLDHPRTVEGLTFALWADLHHVDRSAALEAFEAAKDAGASVEVILDIAEHLAVLDQIRPSQERTATP